MRSKLIFGLIVAVVASTGALALAQEEQPKLEEPETIVHQVGERMIRELDLGRKGPSKGDRLYVRGPLLQDGNRIGKVLAICELFNKNRPYCENEANIEGRGELFSAGFQDFRNPVVLDPILGGTGEFRNARGQITIDFSTGNVTVELLP
jgi:hypothetical protein